VLPSIALARPPVHVGVELLSAKNVQFLCLRVPSCLWHERTGREWRVDSSRRPATSRACCPLRGDQAAGPAWCGQRRAPARQAGGCRDGHESTSAEQQVIPPACRGEAGDVMLLVVWMTIRLSQAESSVELRSPLNRRNSAGAGTILARFIGDVPAIAIN
jgi:hypothetical protein